MEKIRLIKKLTASFDVDSEKCFTPLCPNELPVKDGHLIVDELNAQAKFARLRIGSKDAHNKHSLWVTQLPDRIATPITKECIGDNDANNVDVYWPVHGVPGTKGFELLDGLPKPTEYDYFVWKGIELNMHPYGACYHDLHNKLSTGVIEFLKCNEIINVITGGLATDYCHGLTCEQLLDAGFNVIFNKAASKGISLEGLLAMIKKLKSKGAIIIESANDLETFKTGE